VDAHTSIQPATHETEYTSTVATPANGTSANSATDTTVDQLPSRFHNISNMDSASEATGEQACIQSDRGGPHTLHVSNIASTSVSLDDLRDLFSMHGALELTDLLWIPNDSVVPTSHALVY